MKKFSLATTIVALLLYGAFQAPAVAGPTIATDDGDYSVQFNVQLQPQFQWLSIEGAGKNDSFQIRRGRVVLSGHAWKEALTYKFQFEAVSGGASIASSGQGLTGPNVRSAYLNYDFDNGIQIQVGQFKPYFNREQLTSSTELQFVDRSLTNEVFNFGRDLGLAIHGGVYDDALEYAIFASNDGANRNVLNNNQFLLIGGRFVWNAIGNHGYTLSDVGRSDEAQLAVGAAANYNQVSGPGGGNTKLIAATGDVAFRYQGFSFLGEGHWLRNGTAGTGPQHTFGALGQVGYFLTDEFEVVGRYAAVMIPSTGAFNSTEGYEGGAGLNYFFAGHKVKLQTDYSLLINSALVKGSGAAGAAGVGTNAPRNVVTAAGAPGFLVNRNDHRIRVQLSLYL